MMRSTIPKLRAQFDGTVCLGYADMFEAWNIAAPVQHRYTHFVFMRLTDDERNAFFNPLFTTAENARRALLRVTRNQHKGA